MTQPQFDAAHDGHNPFEAILSPATVGGLQEQWVGKGPVRMDEMVNPLVTDSMVFGAGDQFGSNATTWLIGLDRATGQLLWQADQPFANVVDGIAALDGRVFIATISDGTLRAYDADTGAFEWAYAPSGGVGRPTIAYKTVFVQGNFDLSAIDPSAGVPRWSTSYAGSGGNGGPAVAGSRLFTANGDGDSVQAFDVFTGTALWTAPLDGNDNGSPTAVDGKVFVGTLGGTLYALDQTNGAVVWQAPMGAGTESTPAVADGVVYVGDNIGDLHAYRESDGVQLWTAHTHSAFVLSSPIVANGVVYAATGDAYAFDAMSGRRLWRARTDLVNAGPAVVDGVLYVADFSGTLRAYALPAIAGSR
jgi:outer membrane protein assembly factor BamB